MEPIIKVDNVSMCFNLSKEKHESLKEYFLAMVQGRLQYDEFYALKNVSLDIMPGDFYGLVGLNGSGKSTLLKTIAGVYKPSKGKVTVNGTIAPLIELGAGFDMDLTARENIYLNGTVLGFSPKYLDEKFDEIVEFSELENFLDVPLKNYSSGIRRSPPDTRRPSCRREGQAGRTDGRRPSCGDVRAVEAMGLAGLLLYVSARAGDASGRASGAQVRRAFGSGGGRRKLLAPAGDFRRAASVGPQRGGFACRSRFAVEGPGAVPGDDRVSGADWPARFRRPEIRAASFADGFSGRTEGFDG